MNDGKVYRNPGHPALIDGGEEDRSSWLHLAWVKRGNGATNEQDEGYQQDYDGEER